MNPPIRGKTKESGMKKNGFVFGLLAIGALIALTVSCEQVAGFASKSGEKAVTSFSINSVQGRINGAAITRTLPQGTDVTSLAPKISVSEKARVTTPSGMAQNFTNSVTYVVVAEDGITQIYMVTVTVAGPVTYTVRFVDGDEVIETQTLEGGDNQPGQFIEGFLTVGEVHDVKAALRLSEEIAGCAVIADRGYDSDEFRRELEWNNKTAVIPGGKNRKKETV
jgi:hypothetical protein